MITKQVLVSSSLLNYILFCARKANCYNFTGVTVEGNLLGVYSQGEFIGVAGLLVGYGVWGDLIHAAEADRAAGRLRYASRWDCVKGELLFQN